jgi:uncharacterized Zn finger protein
MPDLFSDASIPIPCPKCGQSSHHRIAQLEINPEIVCAGCGVTVSISINANEFREAIGKVRGHGFGGSTNGGRR